MDEAMVTSGDIDAARVLCHMLGIDEDHAMVIAEFRACARWEGKAEATGAGR